MLLSSLQLSRLVLHGWEHSATSVLLSYQLSTALHFFAGGTLLLFNRKAVRFFRKDGHEWRKKADGKTVRETHEKLKVGSWNRLAESLSLKPHCCLKTSICV